MDKGRKIKVIILFIMAVLSSLLTLLDFIFVDPVPFLDEIGFGGVTIALWRFFIIGFKKSKNNNSQKLLNK